MLRPIPPRRGSAAWPPESVRSPHPPVSRPFRPRRRRQRAFAQLNMPFTSPPRSRGGEAGWRLTARDERRCSRPRAAAPPRSPHDESDDGYSVPKSTTDCENASDARAACGGLIGTTHRATRDRKKRTALGFTASALARQSRRRSPIPPPLGPGVARRAHRTPVAGESGALWGRIPVAAASAGGRHRISDRAGAIAGRGVRGVVWRGKRPDLRLWPAAGHLTWPGRPAASPPGGRASC